MIFLADESVDSPVYFHLKDSGFNIEHVALISPGLSDEKVLKRACKSNKILITVDKDFGDLSFKLSKPSRGIILYRLEGLSNLEKSLIVEKAIRQHQLQLPGNFTVITPKQVRIRKLIL